MKKCPGCQEEKPLDEFGNNASRKDGKQLYCSLCQRAKVRAHYNKNVQYYVNKARKRNDKAVEELREFIYQHLITHPCVDCHETDPLVLQFDHVRGTKTGHISDMVRRGFSLQAIKNEIALCEIRCASCHQRKTAYQLNWWLVERHERDKPS